MKEAEHANIDLPLGGVPIAIKDIINVMGQPCTCASKILDGYRATYDATVIRKIARCRRDSIRQDEHGRVCHGLVD